MKNFYFILFLCLSIISCRKQDILVVPITRAISDSFLIDGHYRTFHFREPTGGSTKSSLIFILHGSGGTGLKMMEQTSGLENLSKNDKLLLVYPDGYKKFWNGCRMKANTPSKIQKINENLFFDKMILYFKNRYKIDNDHFFAIGVSGGGHMAYKLALTMPDRIKGIASIIANLPDSSNMDCPISKIPIAVLIANGTNDPINPYNGGIVKFDNYTLGQVRSTEQTFRYWADLAGYQGAPIYDKVPEQRIERYSYTDSRKPDVVLLKVIGGTHDLPKGIDIFIEAWEFFKKQMAKK